MFRRSLPAIMAAGLLGGQRQALAQNTATYPNKTVRIIVAAAAGGSTDSVARLVAKSLSNRLGQSFFVENRPGAASKTGTLVAARAEPDGHTLILGAVNSHAINPYLFKDLGYHPVNDFAPISQVSSLPNILVTHPSFSATTVLEIIALLKANPGKYAYGSTGRGSSNNLAAVQFMQATGTEMLHVPYNGGGQLVIGLLGNQVQVAFDNITSSLPHIQSGLLRGVAVTSRERSSLLPELPAVAEYLPGFESSSWHGLLAPARTPSAIVRRLSSEVSEILKSQDIQERFAALGAIPTSSTPEEFTAFITSEMERWRRVAEIAGLEPE
jgi:tripartite-type tricarboxylate transporter receptor subunit TctC